MLILKEEKILVQNNVIGSNISRIRKDKGTAQNELVKMLQLNDVNITRKLVKLESRRQHIKLEQLRGVKKVFHLNYEDLLKD